MTGYISAMLYDSCLVGCMDIGVCIKGRRLLPRRGYRILCHMLNSARNVDRILLISSGNNKGEWT